MTDQSAAPPPPPSQPASHALRRSRADRVAAGVCGGLGEHFAVDPVLFRVVFAVSGLFGIGILIYLAAWVAIPEQGTASAPIDRTLAELRRHRVPGWLVVGLLILIAWAILFSWWSPWQFLPIVAVAVLIGVALERHGARRDAPPMCPGAATQRVQADRADRAPGASAPAGATFDAGSTGFGPTGPAATATAATVPPDAGSTAFADLAARAREIHNNLHARRRRVAPVRRATAAALLLTIGVLAICDVTAGIGFVVYFWAAAAVLLVGLAVGIALRRTSWGLAWLLALAVLGAFVFSGTRVSLADGSGDKLYVPRTVADLRAEYRQAFGRTTLDLTGLAAPTTPGTTVTIRQIAGQVRVLVPAGLPVVVRGDVHLGQIEVDGGSINAQRHPGYNVQRDIEVGAAGDITLDGSTATDAITVNVEMNAGQLAIDRVG
ncbi:MAG: PspC domain-containing protein [Actinomycetia bacterium]|nr:PspC domain-containing protein [Actinomycetes bacterium]